MSISVPTHINTPDKIVNILQISDLHLYADINQCSAGINLYDSFMSCLNQALNQDIRCDLILVTGDLVNEMETATYDLIFSILKSTDIAFACVSGNHDVTNELNAHLPFEERTFVAHKRDDRLVAQHRIFAEGWQILLIDSSIPGKVSGKINSEVCEWLDTTLHDADNPAIILMHHHTVATNSKWLDVHISEDSDLFWQLIDKFPQVKAVINGHVHQEHTCWHNNVAVYSTPSTCYQFKKNSDDFALDREARPGYRWVKLQPNAKLETWVERLEERPDATH